MSREQLKAIVKQCLIEILSEGINVTQNAIPRVQQQLQPKIPRGMVETQQVVQRPVQRASPLAAVAAGGNTIMESIFADSLNTTYAEQVANDRVGGNSTIPANSREHISAPPEEIFGEEMAAKWANLAFAGQQDKK